MSVKNASGRFLLALVSGAVLGACSPSASTAVPPIETAASTALLPVAAQAVATPPAAAAPMQPLVTGLPDFTALVERYGPAVVNVRVDERPQQRNAQRRQQPPPSSNPNEELLRRFFGVPDLPGVNPRERTPRRGEGSGFIVSPDGYIMTNAHVVNGATGVVVTLSDRREYEATVVGLDERTDVAVIKVEGKNLPTVKIGDPSKLKPGQWVVAIGSPFGMQNSVTAGIVSATSRDLPQDTDLPAPAFIQTDAAVNPGNSGGPLFNLEGEVVGINSQIYSQSGGYMGLSFAIPIDIADNVRDQLIKTGRVTRSIIGVRIQSVDAARAEAFGLDRPRGALVAQVEEGPARSAGIRPGDIVLSVDGRPVEGSTALSTYISTMAPGTSTELEIWRDGKLRKIPLRVVEQKREGTVPTSFGEQPGRGGAAPQGTEQTVLGLSVRPLTAEDRQQIETQGSLVVEEVSGPAQDAELRPGDIILGVGGTEVRTVAELQAEIKKSPGRNVPLRFQRGNDVGYGTIRKP